MNIAAKHESNGGSIRGIAVAYFFGTVISLWLLSALGVPMPTTPGDTSRDQIVILGLVGALSLAFALFPLARGIGGSAGRRLLTIFAFTFVAFAVINQLQASVFTTVGGNARILAFYAIPCLLASAAATWLVRPDDRQIARPTVFQTRTPEAWWWRPILAVAALPCIEVMAGMMTGPLLEEVITQRTSGMQVPGDAVVLATMLVKSALLLAVTVPIALSWRRTRLHLMVALGAAVFILTGLVGLIQAAWWPLTLRVVFALQILFSSGAYAAVVVALLMPRHPTEKVEESKVTT